MGLFISEVKKMKNSTINIGLVALIFVMFAGYFTWLNFTFKNQISEQLMQAETFAKNENWDEVLVVTKELKNKWLKQKHLLMFNFAEAEFALFENHLSYIIGGAEGKQLDTTLGNLAAAKDLWTNIIKIVPEP